MMRAFEMIRRMRTPARHSGDVVEGGFMPPVAARPEPVWPDVPVVCPQCGGTDIVWDLTCHTWPQGDGDGKTWMSCLPCDSAVVYYCRANKGDYCWNYTHGLNPDNPRSAANEYRRPPWIPSARPTHSRHGIIDTHPGVQSEWDADDE